MPGRDFGYGPYGGPEHTLFGLAFLGLSLLFWLGIPALLVWASLRWIAPRVRGWGAAQAVAQPSAVETLAHRYAVGEIDATTFEQMVERILTAEGRRSQAFPGYQGYPGGEGYQPEPPPVAPADGEVYNT